MQEPYDARSFKIIWHKWLYTIPRQHVPCKNYVTHSQVKVTIDIWAFVDILYMDVYGNNVQPITLLFLVGFWNKLELVITIPRWLVVCIYRVACWKVKVTVDILTLSTDIVVVNKGVHVMAITMLRYVGFQMCRIQEPYSHLKGQGHSWFLNIFNIHRTIKVMKHIHVQPGCPDFWTITSL